MTWLSYRPHLSPIWRHRDFRRLWIGEAISDLGSALSYFALPLVAVVTLHVTPGQMGLIRALGNVPGLFIGLLAGAWVDRVSRRGLLIATNLLAALLVGSIPVAYALDELSVTHLYAMSFAFGLLAAFWSPAWHAFLPSVIEPGMLVEANAKMMLTFSTSGITGPGLGGVLVAIVAAPFVMLFDAVSFVAAALFLRRIRTRASEDFEGEDSDGLWRRIVEGLRVTFLDRMQRALTIPRAFLDFFDALSTTVLVLYIIREVRLTPPLMGLAFALSSVGFVAGSLIAPRVERRLDIGGMIVLGLFLVAVSPYTMVVANDGLPDAVNVLFFAMPGFIGGTGGIIQHVGLLSLRQGITPSRLLGRVYATTNVLRNVLTVLGALVGGLLGETIGLRSAIVVAALGYGIPFLLVLGSPLRSASRRELIGRPGASEPSSAM
jgi:MFS family permease